MYGIFCQGRWRIRCQEPFDEGDPGSNLVFGSSLTRTTRRGTLKAGAAEIPNDRGRPMATVAEPPVSAGPQEGPYPITSDVFQQMIELGLIPQDRRVFLWGGRLYEKMAKTMAHAAVHSAFLGALSRRLPPGYFLGAENPVRLDATHLPLPDLVVVRGQPLDYFDTRYPQGADVALVVEVAVSSLPEDLGRRLSRYALTLPSAAYVVADVRNRRVLVHTGPRAANAPDTGEYAVRDAVGLGGSIRLRLGGVDLEPIPFEEVMR
jgi:Uma2 family endonuclease